MDDRPRRPLAGVPLGHRIESTSAGARSSGRWRSRARPASWLRAAVAGAARPASGAPKTPPTATQSTTKTLNFYNWTDYIADDTIPNFQKQTGIKVTYDNYSSNDDLLAKMQSGVTGYDIVVPTDAYLVRMQKAGLLEPINLANIPNVKNLDPRFRDARVRPGQPVLDSLAVGHDRHRLRQDEGQGAGHRLERAAERPR